MGKLTAKEVAAKSKGEPGRFADGEGLYFVVPKSGKAFWMLRYTANNKRKEMTLAKYTVYNGITLIISTCFNPIAIKERKTSNPRPYRAAISVARWR